MTPGFTGRLRFVGSFRHYTMTKVWTDLQKVPKWGERENNRDCVL